MPADSDFELDIALESIRIPDIPKSVSENINRGIKALKRIISSHRFEPNAVYRKDIGWINLRWGKPGIAPPKEHNKVIFSVLKTFRMMYWATCFLSR